jgi:mannose-6-phosphate isomerase-like protein (cupin superfamily)
MKMIGTLGLLVVLATTAQAQMAAGQSPAPPVTSAKVAYFESAKVAAGFAKGENLLVTPAYRVQAGRRDQPGLAEIHTYETDIDYVVEGSATFVTGGTVPDVKATAPGEFRGSKIVGGEVHQLKKGDVIVVPAGVPHWFSEVKPGFLYFVVKSIAPK